MFSKDLKSFTIVELAVVIVIIAILAAIALPSYRKAIDKSKEAEAFTTLGAMYRAWRSYYDAQGVNPGISDIDIELPNVRGMLDQPSTKYWTYYFGSIGGGASETVAYAVWYDASRIRDIGITANGVIVYYNGLMPP